MEPLKESRLSKLLKKALPGEEIKSFKVSPGSKEGDNVIGKMVTVELETSSGSCETLIVKGLVPFGHPDPILSQQDKLFAQVMSIFDVYAVEISYYERIRSAVEKYYSPKLWLPTPKYFYGLNDTEGHGINSVLLLEDIRPKGFRMADVMQGLNYSEVKLVLHKLANFHGVAYAYLSHHQRKFLDEFKNRPESLLVKKDPLSFHVFGKMGVAEEDHRGFQRDLFFKQLEYLQETGGITEGLLGKIRKAFKDPGQVIVDSWREAGNEYFYTVIHGDLWVNNVLFKYEESGKPVQVSFIDFQQTRYASVFDDLHYFLYTSTTADFRKEHLEELLDYYYKQFCLSVKAADANVPFGFSKEEFLKGFRKYLRSAFSYAVQATPFHVGVMPKGPPPSEEEGKKEEGMEGGDAEGEGEEVLSPEGLREHFKKLFGGLGGMLLGKTVNSPVALDRLKQLCLEMDGLGVFD